MINTVMLRKYADEVESGYRRIGSFFRDIWLRLELLVTANPNIADYFESEKLSSRAFALASAGDFPGAISLLTQAVEKSPRNCYGFICRGIVYLRNSEYRRALADCQRALAIKPDLNFSVFFTTRGRAYHFLKDYARALADMEKAVALNPWCAKDCSELAALYLEAGEWGRAVEFYRKAIGLDPEEEKRSFYLAYAFQQKEDYQPALAAYSRALEKTPDLAEFIYYGMAEIHRELKDLDRALENADRCVGIFEKDKEQGRWESTQASLITLSDRRSIICLPYFLRGMIHMDRSEFDLAITDFNGILEYPRLATGSIYAWRGLAYMNKDDFEKALADFIRSVEKKPEKASNWYNLAVCRIKTGDKAEALRCLARAMGLDPERIREAVKDNDTWSGIREE